MTKHEAPTLSLSAAAVFTWMYCSAKALQPRLALSSERGAGGQGDAAAILPPLLDSLSRCHLTFMAWFHDLMSARVDAAESLLSLPDIPEPDDEADYNNPGEPYDYAHWLHGYRTLCMLTQQVDARCQAGFEHQ